MRIVVCIKHVASPDAADAVFSVDGTGLGIASLTGVPWVISPFDEQAVEVALRLKDASPETMVTLVTVGSREALQSIKRGLSMGADDAVLIEAEGPAANDPRLTARILSDVIRDVEDVGLVLTGQQATDWDRGVVGFGVAEMLRWPVVGYAYRVFRTETGFEVERVCGSARERVLCPAPCVLTVSNEVGVPRKPTLKETMRAGRKPVVVRDGAQWAQTVASLPIEAGKGRRIALQRVDTARRCVTIEGDDLDAVARALLNRLELGRTDSSAGPALNTGAQR